MKASPTHIKIRDGCKIIKNLKHLFWVSDGGMMAVSHPKGNQSKWLTFLVYVVLQSINCNSHLLGSDFTSGAPYSDWKLYENYYLSFSFLFFVDDKVPLKKMVCQKQLEKQCTMSSIGNLQKISGDWVSLFWNYLPEWDTSSDLNIKEYIYIFISHTLSSPRPAQTQIKAFPRRLV